MIKDTLYCFKLTKFIFLFTVHVYYNPANMKTLPKKSLLVFIKRSNPLNNKLVVNIINFFMSSKDKHKYLQTVRLRKLSSNYLEKVSS